MDTSINLPDNYLEKLLSLSDDMKLRIINKLSESLLNSENRHHVHTRKSKIVKDKTALPEDIQSLIGIVSDVNDPEDERLNYLLRK
ncbi:hypothetical protein AAE250_03760 [Bacteroides sp. GD17]|jgi:hypothetical protein|uniref:hypothetical protein n=1 Tax=Bacteroides sp. GD17 TaxID=3139826 RepID=UPI0025D83743|nr:hypothetical protein [uncultured Bacteroides sp.]